MPTRRQLLEGGTHTCAAALVAGALPVLQDESHGARSEEPQRFFIFSMVGSENPTRANFPFVWAAALHEAGHEVRMELAGDATVPMRDVVVENVAAVGWPPMKQIVEKVREHEIPIYV